MIKRAIDTTIAPSVDLQILQKHEPSTAHEHVVQFSENDVSLIKAVGTFIASGLHAGDACLVVVTPSHRKSLEHYLQSEGIDLTAAQEAGTYIALDATATLRRFLVDGELDPAQFTTLIGGIIEQSTQNQRRVRIFGEMVALLWAEGNQTAAIRLEDLWNSLSQTHTFSLFCAYPMSGFHGNVHEEQFRHICQQHSHVIPDESYGLLSDEERLRAFALLQQKAHSLEIEVAERQAAEERLRVLAAIVESSDDAILSKDLEGIITSWNAGAERMYGYTAEEMIGQSVTRLFPPNQQEEFHQIMGQLRHGERVDHYHTKRMHKDGSMLTVAVTVSPVKDKTGTIVGASAIARDLTERQRLEARLHQLFASKLVGVFVANAEGTLLEANQAFLDLVGYTRDEWQRATRHQRQPLQQASFTSSVVSPLRPLILTALQETGDSEPQELVLQRKSGKDLPVLVAVTCLEDRETCIGFVLDISERKALEQRKDEFIGMASHELKTPVTSLKGYLFILQRQLASQENDKLRYYLARMDAQINKLTNLINDLLDIARMQNGHLVYREERVEVDAWVQEIVESVQGMMETHHLQLEGHTHATVLGDRDRLGQVVINLLNNAIKYSPEADRVLVRLATDERYMLISVQDFGLGIAKEHHRKIFERFYQVTDPEEKTYPGLGIGLFISSEIARRHRGQLWVESQKGEGATFYLRLPLIQDDDSSLQGCGREEQQKR